MKEEKTVLKIKWKKIQMLLILLKKIWKKRKFHDIDSKIAEAADARKMKMILEFNNRESA